MFDLMIGLLFQNGYIGMLRNNFLLLVLFAGCIQFTKIKVGPAQEIVLQIWTLFLKN